MGNIRQRPVSKAAVQSEENSFSKSEILPPPPGGRRTLALGGLIVVGLLALVVGLWLVPAARYALTAGPPTDVGRLEQADLEGKGEWIRGTGTPELDALAFRRRGQTGSFRLTRLADRANLWLVLPVPKGATNSTEPNAPVTIDTYVPPNTFVGRLVAIEDAGPMLAPIVKMLRVDPPPQGYLLLEGDSPRSYRHFLVAAVLLAILGLGCLSFAVHLAKRAP